MEISSLIKFWSFPSTLVLAICSTAPSVAAQTQPSLSIQSYAGLSITGQVGTVYTVQYATNLDQPDWRGGGIVQLPSSPYLWVDTAAPATGHRFYRALEGPTNMVWIPPGTFTMGSPSNELERVGYEGPQTVVTLTRGFFMGRYEVTQGEYLAIVGSNPSYFRNGTQGSGPDDTVTNELRHPVEEVSWFDATNYCSRLSEQERVAGRLPPGWAYRLPTEAEWEYACRAGTTSAFHYGPALRFGMANFYGPEEYDSSVGTVENPAGIWFNRTTVVGSYEPNAWGLYDMHGNVWEWCSDWMDLRGLPGGRVVDPQGLSEAATRALRGGAWNVFARLARSAYRSYGTPFLKTEVAGFRVVLASNP